MTPSSIVGFVPADTPKAPQSARDSGGGDLFGDLMRGQLNPSPRTAEAPPKSDPPDRPTPSAASDKGDAATSDDQQANAPDRPADSGDDTQARDTDATKGKAKDTKDTKGAKDAKDGKPDDKGTAQAAAQVNAPVASAVLAVAAQGAPPEGGQVSAAAHGGVAPAASVVPPATTPPTPPAPNTAPDAALVPPAPADSETPGQNGQLPLQAEVTVAGEGKKLVSRPAASLAAAHAADLAAAKDKANGGDKNGTLSNAAVPAGKAAAALADKTAGGGKPTADHAAATRADAPAPLFGDGQAAGHKAAGDVPGPAQPAAHTAAAAGAIQLANPAGGASAQAPNLVNVPRPAAAAVPTPATFDDVAVQISKAAADGLDKISIQLKPESLGRIDVQLQVAHDGHVNATIAVHRQDTLDLLQRDARSLQRALQDAGLHADAGSLNFNLSGQGRDNMPPAFAASPAAAIPGGDADPMAAPSPAALAYNYAAARGGIDIRV